MKYITSIILGGGWGLLMNHLFDGALKLILTVIGALALGVLIGVVAHLFEDGI